MEFGLQFFPNFSAEQKTAAEYWTESLRLVDLCDSLGYTHVRTVEHYFHQYGGNSPSPLLFLAAAAMRTQRARLVTGAVLPVFNHPLKLAGQLAMVDAISNGRLEAGFARAFLPHEFKHFGIPLDESRARFEEGVEQVQLLLEREQVTHRGQFHAFEDVTSLPRPTQRPRPPFWVAALNTPASFVWAGERGHGVMGVPMTGGTLRERIGEYREAWKRAGHPGDGRVMLAFHMFCHRDRRTAEARARGPLERYMAANVDAAKVWTTGISAKDYPAYDKVIARLEQQTFDSQVAQRVAWVGSPADIIEMIHEFGRETGPFEIASLQVNFNDIAFADAETSMSLFAREVMPSVSAWAHA